LPGHAFSTRARLTGSASFTALLRAKSVARGSRFIVHAVQNQKSFARLGIIVGKRTVQHAVARNFLKRLIRETFRAQQQRLVGYDVLVRVRRPVVRGDARIAQAELTDLLDAAVA